MEPPIRVALVHYRDAADAGGSLRVGETIANHLDPRRVSAEMVFAYGGPGPVAKRAHVPCHFISATGPKDFPAWLRARALFRKLRPDIIHFQDAVVWLRTALIGSPYRTVFHVHARATRESRTERAKRTHPLRASKLLRAYLKLTDAQVCINHGARNALLDLGWIEPAKSCVVYNSIDTSRFRELGNQERARERLALPKDALLVGMVCRLVWEKGCTDFLSVLERLPDYWHGVICGDGPLKEELMLTVKGHGLANRVHFISSQDDVGPVYAALDAYAFVSHYEPFGLVLTEAMAAGLPVFGIQGDGEFNDGALPLLTNGTADLVPFARNGNYETAVPDEIFDQVAARITDYGERPEAYREMVTRACTWVSSCFDAGIQAEAMTRVYEAIYVQGHPSQAELASFYETRREEGVTAMLSIQSRQFATATA